MKHPETLILYVEDTGRSAAFFHTLFAAPIVEQSPNFAMLLLPGGLMLGIWARRDVKPEPAEGTAGFELVVTVDSDGATDAALAEARNLGIPVVQEPVRLDFGYTFVLRSPDGHLIRVFSPSPASP
jgi:catechol 2,3-dioxygenase-like lactoylglutathione lyase family enzyme